MRAVPVSRRASPPPRACRQARRRPLPSARRRGRRPARTLRRRSSSHREACPDLVIGDTFTA
ncbi:hypothetical protein CP979_04085 [Streptomyces filamentosus]|nr:hypothetical protein CP979_04085 [Streptomyces filamentosus]